MTNAERGTDEMRKRMDHYEQKLKVLFESPNATVNQALSDIDSNKIIDTNSEDPEFFDEFTRVIDDARL
jgi:hypothetical protein